MDSFEDLENPPTSIQNVVNNRWLNSSFKETVSDGSHFSTFKFDKKSDKYETRRKKYLNYHLDCLSEIELSHSFIFANYLMLDEQPIY